MTSCRISVPRPHALRAMLTSPCQRLPSKRSTLSVCFPLSIRSDSIPVSAFQIHRPIFPSSRRYHSERSPRGSTLLPLSGGHSPRQLWPRENQPVIPRAFHGTDVNWKEQQHDPTGESLVSSSSEQGQDLLLETHDSGHIVTLTFNRPKAANAMGTQMLRDFTEAIRTLRQNEHARCVILTSCSTRVFSAGADLRERAEMTQDEAAAFVTTLRSTFEDVSNLPMPVLAAVEGVAVGGGLEIALTCDFIVSGKNAAFGLPETSLAIMPGAGGTQRLSRSVGVARAKDLIFTARKISAQVAYEYGLVQYLVHPGGAESKAMEIAREIAGNGPIAIRAAKSAINDGMDASTIKDAMEIERECYQRVIPTADRLEGLAAFREKRKPVYKGE